MGFRLFRRIKIAPGITFNLSKTGGSFSFGVRGARVTLGRTGIRKTVGIPGTGLYYTTHESWQATNQKHSSPPPQKDLVPHEDKPYIPWYRYVFLSNEMKLFWKAIQAFYSDRPNYARALLQRIHFFPDARFLLAITWINEREYTNALTIIEDILNHGFSVGKQFDQLKFQPTIKMEIEAGWGMELPCSDIGLKIAGAMCQKQLHRETEAFELLYSDSSIQEMLEVQLLMADIYISANDHSPSGNRTALEEVIRIVRTVENKNDLLSPVCRYYCAKAMRRLGYFDQTEKTLIQLLVSSQLDDLYIKYELARTYEDAGKTQKAQKIFQEIFAKSPEFLDIRDHLVL